LVHISICRSYFDTLDKDIQALLDGSKYSQKNMAEKLQVLFGRPFSHVKEYCRLTDKLACNYEQVRNKNINGVFFFWCILFAKQKSYGFAQNSSK
jgi:hypothetical protein